MGLYLYGFESLCLCTTCWQALAEPRSNDGNLMLCCCTDSCSFPPGTSALHIASWNGSLQMVKLLLRAYVSRAMHCVLRSWAFAALHVLSAH